MYILKKLCIMYKYLYYIYRSYITIPHRFPSTWYGSRMSGWWCQCWNSHNWKRLQWRTLRQRSQQRSKMSTGGNTTSRLSPSYRNLQSSFWWMWTSSHQCKYPKFTSFTNKETYMIFIIWPFVSGSSKLCARHSETSQIGDVQSTSLPHKMRLPNWRTKRNVRL